MHVAMWSDSCPNVRHQEMTNAVNLVDGGVTVTRETLLSGILAARWTQYNNTNWDTWDTAATQLTSPPADRITLLRDTAIQNQLNLNTAAELGW